MVLPEPLFGTKGKVEILKMRRVPFFRDTHFSNTTLAQRTFVRDTGLNLWQ
ncbi:MAG: hypothetical protein JWQ09_4716 [Segetibacter sp.]|nr:hypothetical protein [Segetibacter sp.]